MWSLRYYLNARTMHRMQESMNSLNVAVFARLKEIALAVRDQKDTCKVLVLTAAGERAFSAGNDVKGGSFTSAAGGAVSRRLQVETIEALDAVPQPLIGAGH